MCVGEDRLSRRKWSKIRVHDIFQRMLHDVLVSEMAGKAALKAKDSGVHWARRIGEVSPESDVHLLGEVVSLLQMDEPRCCQQPGHNIGVSDLPAVD